MKSKKSIFNVLTALLLCFSIFLLSCSHDNEYCKSSVSNEHNWVYTDSESGVIRAFSEDTNVAYYKCSYCGLKKAVTYNFYGTIKVEYSK